MCCFDKAFAKSNFQCKCAERRFFMEIKTEIKIGGPGAKDFLQQKKGVDVIVQTNAPGAFFIKRRG